MSLRSVLESIILLKSYPRTTITLIVQVLHDGGSLLATIINTSLLALADAGIALGGFLAAVTVGVPPSSPSALVDLSTGEEVLNTTSPPAAVMVEEGKMVDDGATGHGMPASESPYYTIQAVSTYVFGTHNLSLREEDWEDDEVEGGGVERRVPFTLLDVLILMESCGKIPISHLQEIEDTARLGCATIAAFLKLALKRKIKRDMLTM